VIDRGSPWWIAGVSLSIALLALAPLAWRRLGARRGLRWLAVAIVPAGLAMSGLAVMLGRIGLAVGRFFSGFVFSPFVWAGFALLGGAVALEFAARAMGARGMGGASGETTANRPAEAGQIEPSRKVPSTRAPVDDDMADIEELLRRRGIT
jgi:hypothetical protein